MNPRQSRAIMQKHAKQRPRVEQTITDDTSVPLPAMPPPRVTFEEQIAEHDKPRLAKPTWMIVASTQEPDVVLPKPSLLKPPKFNEEPDTIAARLKACRNKAQIVNDSSEEKIADRVARR